MLKVDSFFKEINARALKRSNTVHIWDAANDSIEFCVSMTKYDNDGFQQVL